MLTDKHKEIVIDLMRQGHDVVALADRYEVSVKELIKLHKDNPVKPTKQWDKLEPFCEIGGRY